MKIKELQELLDFIAGSGLDEVNIETDSYKLAVKRNSTDTVRYVDAPKPAQVQAPVVERQIAAPVQEKPATPPASAEPSADSKLITIKSPMIGTFYKASGPDTPAFASVGDSISKGQTVCIIEAMKLFNEIESDVSGKIVKILVEDASPVEYDQPLFLVDPS